MPRYDRLSALLTRFELHVTPGDHASSNLAILASANDGTPDRIVFSPERSIAGNIIGHAEVLFSAQVAWGGSFNPLLSTLPSLIEIEISEDSELIHITRLLQIEGNKPRCGSGTILDRLGEVLMVRLLRSQLEAGTTRTGLIGGLSDPRLSRAIVAMHEAPGRQWRNEDLADIAGLSLSRFSELFAERVGETPIAYLRRWRMVLAYQDAERGDRIQAIARRYGYRSGEALSRAFRREFDTSAVSLRRSMQS
ncbi:MAG: AraC family transcriptional regulator [Pseudomonadota bacterium]